MDDRTTTDVAANPFSTFDLGACIGWGQAFSFVANHCSAAQAECLTRIRKDGLYKALNLTWEEFCKQHAGVSRAHADEIILAPVLPRDAGHGGGGIRQAISALRTELRRTQAAQARLDACFDDMSSLSLGPLDVGERAAFQGLIRYTFNKIKRMARTG
jgi:hypothetical protein